MLSSPGSPVVVNEKNHSSVEAMRGDVQWDETVSESAGGEDDGGDAVCDVALVPAIAGSIEDDDL